jgi:acyl-CoA reductase-like NAD-dependent aldehyde dehydrogenase
MIAREYPGFYIDGRWQAPQSSERFEVVSPATGKPIGFVPFGIAGLAGYLLAPTISIDSSAELPSAVAAACRPKTSALAIPPA